MSGASTRRYSPRRPREERREQLLDAALRLVDALGFGAFSIEAVAREANLTKSVVYATFGSREELLRALVDRELERAFLDITHAIARAPGADPDQVLRDALTGVLESVRARPETWRLFVLPADGMPLAARANVTSSRERLHERVHDLIAWGLRELDAEHVDAEVMAMMMIACFEQAARMTLTAPERFPLSRLLQFLTDFIATRQPQPDGESRVA